MYITRRIPPTLLPDFLEIRHLHVWVKPMSFITSILMKTKQGNESNPIKNWFSSNYKTMEYQIKEIVIYGCLMYFLCIEIVIALSGDDVYSLH